MILELDGLQKRFGGLVATNNVSAALAKGESLGLIGPNGAGKTTIFSLIMGEHRLDAGTIRLNGTDISRLPTHARIKRGVARTYQVPRPFAEMSVAENIRIGRGRGNWRKRLGLTPPISSACHPSFPWAICGSLSWLGLWRREPRLCCWTRYSQASR